MRREGEKGGKEGKGRIITHPKGAKRMALAKSWRDAKILAIQENEEKMKRSCKCSYRGQLGLTL
jgi:hypothetical protein